MSDQVQLPFQRSTDRNEILKDIITKLQKFPNTPCPEHLGKFDHGCLDCHEVTKDSFLMSMMVDYEMRIRTIENRAALVKIAR